MVINELCYCNRAWNSILPPPCPHHMVQQVWNGMCYCRGHLNPHPFHGPIPSAGHLTTTDKIVITVPREYVGKHRVPSDE